MFPSANDLFLKSSNFTSGHFARFSIIKNKMAKTIKSKNVTIVFKEPIPQICAFVVKTSIEVINTANEKKPNVSNLNFVSIQLSGISL